jgi:hypothetical protein
VSLPSFISQGDLRQEILLVLYLILIIDVAGRFLDIRPYRL